MFSEEKIQIVKDRLQIEFLDVKLWLRLRLYSLKVLLLGKFASISTSEDFFLLIISMISKFIYFNNEKKVDEFNALKDFLKTTLLLDTSASLRALQHFQKSRHSKFTFEDYSNKFYEHYGHHKILLELAIDVMLKVAMANGRYDDAEKNLVNSALRIFNFSTSDFERIKARRESIDHLYMRREKLLDRFDNTIKNKKTSAHRAHRQKKTSYKKSNYENVSRKKRTECRYKVLNCSPGDSMKKIKKAYRDLVLEYHPDRLYSKGLSKELLELSIERFRQVQEAYDVICRERGE